MGRSIGFVPHRVCCMLALEAMLYGQAVALQIVFTSLSRRAALNAGEHLQASELYLLLAVKAHAVPGNTGNADRSYVDNMCSAPESINRATHSRQFLHCIASWWCNWVSFKISFQPQTQPTGHALMATKKTTPTFDELTKQIIVLQAQAAEARRREVSEVVAKIKEAVRHFGLTAADLGLNARGAKAPAAGTVAATKKRAKKAAVKKSAKPIKYRDDAGNAWVGHGKRPKWFVDAIAAGKKAEDMLVKSAA